MNNEQREALENLVFAPVNPYLALDARLQPFLDLIADIEGVERERCAQIAAAFVTDNGDEYYAADIAAAIQA